MATSRRRIEKDLKVKPFKQSVRFQRDRQKSLRVENGNWLV